MNLNRSLLLLLAFLPATAWADDDIKTATTRMAACVHNRDASTCRQNITASSTAILDRFASYDLMDCLPQDAAYQSSKQEGDAMIVRATTTTDAKKNTIRLVFQQEEEEWKLDIPESLRRGLGDNWEQRLNGVEQVYLVLRSQMGGNLNCAMIRKLGTGLTASGGKP